MPKAIRAYVRTVDRVSHVVGRFAMLLIYAMIGVLLYHAISRAVFDVPLIWVVEVAQFLLVSYFLLGGAYSMQLDSHVRMDLLYSRWSPRRKAWADVFTIFFLIFYLGFLLAGGISSTSYALEYNQTNYSTWAPVLWPIKIIMTFGVLLMLLQAFATFFKNIAEARGKPIA